jgi:hypothetical protein
MSLVGRTLLILGVAARMAIAGPVQDPPQILRVERAARAPTGSPSLVPARLRLFTPAATPSAEVFHVYWRAPARGAPVNTLVTFEYRQRYSPAVRFLAVRYPFVATGENKATFRVAGPESPGPVVAWRVRVVWGGRRMAERASPSWEALS